MLDEGIRGASPKPPWEIDIKKVLPKPAPIRSYINPSYVPAPRPAPSGGGGGTSYQAVSPVPTEQISNAIGFLKANLQFNIAADDVKSSVRARPKPSGAAAVGPNPDGQQSSVKPWDVGLTGFNAGLGGGKGAPKINITKDRVQTMAVVDPVTGMSIPVGRSESMKVMAAQKQGQRYMPEIKPVARRPFLRGLNNFILPVEGMSYEDMVGDFGPRVHPVTGGSSYHTGVDYGAGEGTPVYAPSNGVVGALNPNAGAYGNQIILEHGKDLQTMYGHLTGFANIAQGQKIKKGDVIGYIGSTGLSTGSHLHWETWRDGSPFNPITIMGGS